MEYSLLSVLKVWGVREGTAVWRRSSETSASDCAVRALPALHHESGPFPFEDYMDLDIGATYHDMQISNICICIHIYIL